jgi:hypothetical protein
MRALADRVRAVLALLGPLGAGSRVLLLRLIGRFGWKTVGIGALICVFAAVRYRTWIAWMLTAWCIAAWMHAPTDDTEPTTELAGEEPAEPDPQDIADLIRDLIGDDRGILLTTLCQPLQEPDTRAVKEVLQAAGIRWRPGVRTAGGNGPGVHRDDVPPPPPDPEATGVGSLTCTNGANANADNKLRVESREGMTIISDPADRHRTHRLRKP